MVDNVLHHDAGVAKGRASSLRGRVGHKTSHHESFHNQLPVLWVGEGVEGALHQEGKFQFSGGHLRWRGSKVELINVQLRII